MRKPRYDFDDLTSAHMPMSERILDRLADILLAADDILDMVTTDPLLPGDRELTVEGAVRKLYNDVNTLMKQLAD